MPSPVSSILPIAFGQRYPTTSEQNLMSQANQAKSEFSLQDFDFNQVQSGVVHMSAPLLTGYHWMPGLYQKALVSVKSGTVAEFMINIGKNSKCETVVTRAVIKLNKPVKIKNPSTAYEKSNGWNDVKDLFSSIHIQGIHIDHQGRILFQGDIQKGLSREDIKTAFKPEMFPKLDLRLEALKNQNTKWEGMDLNELGKSLGLILRNIKTSVSIRVQLPKTMRLHEDLAIQGNSQSADLKFHGLCTLKRKGDLIIKPDPEFPSEMSVWGLLASLKGSLSISNLFEKKSQIVGNADLDLSIPSTELRAFYQDRVTIPIMLGHSEAKNKNHLRIQTRFQNQKITRASVTGLLDVHIGDLQPIQRKDWTLAFQKAHLHLEGSASLKSLRGLAEVTVSHPRLAWKEFHSALKGEAGISVKARSLEQGELQYRIKSDRLRTFERTLGYRFFPDESLALQPYNTGIGGFLDPKNEFVWDPESLCRADTLPIGGLGSAVWKEHIEMLTKAKIRKNNRAQVLVDGKESYPKRLELIRSAKKSIMLQTLIFKEDETGMEIAKALVEAKQRGVEVRVIIDSLGNLESLKDLVCGHTIYGFLKQNGIALELYGDSAVQGIQEIIAVLDQNRLLGEVQSIQDWIDPNRKLSVFNFLSKLLLGTLTIHLNEEGKSRVHQALKLILKHQENSDFMIERLMQMSPESPLQLEEIMHMFESILSLNYRWHEKYLIVDEEKAFMGGMNIADEYLKGGLGENVLCAGHKRPAWRDTDILVEGEAAWDAYVNFARNWKHVSGEEIDLSQKPVRNWEDGVEVQVIQSRPHLDKGHPITNFKVESIKCLKAGDKAYEASAYFMPVGGLREYVRALKNAAQRGVDVRILTNSAESTDVSQINQAVILCCYRTLLASGVRIFECIGSRTMHQKTAVYGTLVSQIGSANLDNRSDSLNSETLVSVYDREFAHKTEHMLLQDMAPEQAREIKLKDIESSFILNELYGSLWGMLAEWM